MNRRTLLMTLFGVGPLISGSLVAKGKDKGQGKGKGRDKDHGSGEGRGRDSEAGYFRREDYGAIQRYYAGPQNLPPGLRKKYYRTGKLPPGWQKKMRPFPPELVRVLPPPPPNCAFGYIDGVALVYDRKTRIILDTIDLVSAIAGH